MSRTKEHICVVYDRLREVVPVQRYEDMSDDEVLKAINTAFNIISYTPVNLEESISKSKTTFIGLTDVSLFDFIYQVWRYDNAIL